VYRAPAVLRDAFDCLWQSG